MTAAARPAPERVGWRRGDPPRALLDREWLVTNGLGGYASGTLSGVLTRRYHALLVAALPVPQGRTVMLARVDDALVEDDGTVTPLTARDPVSGAADHSALPVLSSFCLERGLPVWTFAWDDHVVEKRVLMSYGENTTHVIYRRAGGPGSLRLRLRPFIAVRRLEDPVSTPIPSLRLEHSDGRHGLRIDAGPSALRLHPHGGAMAVVAEPRTEQQFYALEAARGYESRGDLWTPGVLEVGFDDAGEARLVVSTETPGGIHVRKPSEASSAETRRRTDLLARLPGAASHGAAAELALAADQFIVTPQARVDETSRARDEGDELRTVIAGYHWFTDWGRDTMISLEGLTLATQRPRDSALILRTFARHVRRGLIPNLIPETGGRGLYHTADATLWFFHALDRYVAATGDMHTLVALLPMLHDVVAWHVRGTDFNIGVDPRDGLLHQGQQGYQLTWMDAKVGDWVVTPRRGKAVEIQALWYNALRLLECWTRDEQHDARRASRYADLAERTRSSFNARFWDAERGHLYDVVDGDDGGSDASCRPNQLLALSLTHPVLAPERWSAVLDVVTHQLLTPVGLRSLAPGSPGYCARYDGDLRSRDAAYHQGTVWGWLIGPYIDAWLRVHGDARAARTLLDGLLEHLGDAGVGQLSEIFDAEPPFTPRGCIAQAWTVAEVLRCLVRIDAAESPTMSAV